MGNDDLLESLAELHRQMASLHDLEHEMDRSVLANILQVRIVQELLRGRRTVARLVEEFYDLRKGDSDYSTFYSRVRKEVGDLESRGLVSRRLFGRDKPYGLTQLGIERLTQLRCSPASKMVSVLDGVIYTSALVLGTICAGVIMAGATFTTPIALLAFAFVFMGGLSFSHLLGVLRRVRPISVPGDVKEAGESRKGGETETMWKPDDSRDVGVGRGRIATKGRLSMGMTMTTKVLGFGVLFGAVFLLLGSMALQGVGDGPTYLGIPPDEGWEIPSRGERFRLDMSIDEFKAEFRLTDGEAAQLGVLVDERDVLQEQVEEKLKGIRDIIGPGLHKLDVKKLKKEFDLTEEETVRLEGLIEDWMSLGMELQRKTNDILGFLASIGVIRAR